MTNPHRLRAQGATLAYGDRTVTTDLDLSIATGKVTAIVGANGCGKSTLLRALSRLIAPRSGQIVLDGKDLHRLPAKEVARVLGLLPQSPIAPEGIVVSDLVGRGRHPHQRLLAGWTAKDYASVAAALEATGTVALADRPVDELSGGQRQRVWIAMALAQETDILLLDEPGLSLHAKAQADLMRFIEERLAPQHQVIYTTHSPFMVPMDRLADVRIVEDVISFNAKRARGAMARFAIERRIDDPEEAVRCLSIAGITVVRDRIAVWLEQGPPNRQRIEVIIADGAIVAAATLSNRYITDRFLPDKAIDLIDEAGARMRIRRMTAPPDLREFDEKIADARREKESAIDAQDFEKAASLRDREKQLVAQRAEREKQWRSGDLDVVAEVDDEQIAEVLGNWTGIPVFKLTEAETTRLLRMEDELHKRIIGQEDAVKAVSKAIRRTRAGLKDPKRPSGSFIFAGPSGVGKTELSKALAEFLFGDDDALIQIDMGEFHDRFTASRLFGAPPGYVGYEEGGQLTEKVRRKPFSVVLFDEIEKAHQEIYNTLLQVLEDGRLTDGQGRTVDFRNTVIAMTSNLGSQLIQEMAGNDGEAAYTQMKAAVLGVVQAHFRPEFINRLDELVVFHPLEKAQIRQIARIQTEGLARRMAERQLRLQLDERVLDLLGNAGFDPVYGARPLKRAIQEHLENPLAREILAGRFAAGDTVRVDAEGGKLVFRREPASQAA